MLDPDSAFQKLRGDGQPASFVFIAVQIASSPDWLRNLIRVGLGDGDAAGLFKDRPSYQQWKKLYRCHRRMQNEIAKGLGYAEEYPASECLDELREVSRMSQEEIAEGVAEMSEEEMKIMLLPFLGIPFPPEEAALKIMLDELETESDPSEEDGVDAVDRLADSPIGQFFVRVWMPCWIIYHEYAPCLMRSARSGDLKALDRLLRLDKHALADPMVARRVSEIMGEGTRGERNQLTAALGGKVKTSMSDKAMRSGLGALISQLALLFQTSVTAPEIEELFNRIERVRTGNLADPAVPTGETWSKAIQRNRNWPSMPKRLPDSK